MAAASPFHSGEQEIQQRFGMRSQIEEVGQRFIRDFLPDQHREFYQALPFIVIGSIDEDGWPWASLLAGRPGFIDSPDDTTLHFAAQPEAVDPLSANLRPGARLGFLGIEYQNRRRNRLTGRVTATGPEGFSIQVDQTFGNCPKFIQAREPVGSSIANTGQPKPQSHELTQLDERSRQIIQSADHFFIASYYSEDRDDPSQGADVSHRGGKPGFVKIDGDRTLTFPDFSGNYHFNTLGNILMNPRAGLLFMDFSTGDMLYLSCLAKLIWEGPDLDAFKGAERLVQFEIQSGRLVENGLPLSFDFVDYSPFVDQTGSWEEVAARQAELASGTRHREFHVTRIEDESANVRSFYLEPTDGGTPECHEAGQFLPVQLEIPGSTQALQRTYTISNAPNGRYYRLSVKREPAPADDLPPGQASGFLHDNITVGSTLRALSPRGKFVLDKDSTRPVVFISAGVGVTPMISMLEQMHRNAATCGCTRPVYFIHGARNARELAFGTFVRELANRWPNLNAHVRFSQPDSQDAAGKDFDSAGRVDVELLKSLLPLDDYEYYLCGPAAFMESMYTELQALNIQDERIHYEYFGAGKTLSAKTAPGAAVSDRPPVAVRFARSAREALWEPASGTLLELAESEGLEPAYSCRSGVCQTCAVQVESGSVDYAEAPAVAPPPGMALICSAYPVAPEEEAAPVVLDL